VVPTPSPSNYQRKFKELFRTWKAAFRTKILRKKAEHSPWQIKEEGFCSPFEDTSGEEIIAGVIKYFDIERTESYGGVKIGLLEGKITIVYARKRSQG
jgi:hypothetical protein